MGTCSYVLTGTERGMTETFGSTCHGAVSSVFSARCAKRIIMYHKNIIPCIISRCKIVQSAVQEGSTLYCFSLDLS